MSVATVDSLIRASSSSLLQPLLVPGALLSQVDPQPGQVPQPADLSRRDKRGPQHAPLVQLAQPHRIQLVGLGPTRDLLDVPRVDQPHQQPVGLEQVHKRPPVIRRGLHHDPLDPLADQTVGQLHDRGGGRGNIPHCGDPLTRLGLVWHARADHARRLAHVDRGDPRQDLLLLLDLDLPALWHRPLPSSPHRRAGRGVARGLGGNRNSDRRARSDSARPFCLGPGARLIHGLQRPRTRRRRRATRPIFTPARRPPNGGHGG